MQAHLDQQDAQLSDLKKSLTDLQLQSDQQSRNHHTELTLIQNSNRAITQNYDEHISSLQTKHSKLCDDLRRQLLQSQLETDRLRLQLASLEMKLSPRKADRIMARTLRDAAKQAAATASTATTTATMATTSTTPTGGRLILGERSTIMSSSTTRKNGGGKLVADFWRILGIIVSVR